jgi:ribonuclease HI
MNLIIHTDGGARGNPGPAAVGVFIEACICPDPKKCQESKRKIVKGFGKKIGETTNNTAEYTAVIEALTYVRDIMPKATVKQIVFVLDSTLVVNQINGVYKVKESHLRMFVMNVHMLESEIGAQISYTIVRREYNRDADFYVNQALDS